MRKKISIIIIILGSIFITVSLVLHLVDNQKINNEPINNNNNNSNSKKTSAFDIWNSKLPNGWNMTYLEDDDDMNVTFESVSEDVTVFNEPLFNIPKISFTGKSKEELFKDTTFFKEHFQLADGVSFVGDGKRIERGGKPVLIFECNDDNDFYEKFLIAYMPVDDEYFYYIQFFSKKVIGDNEEAFYNYDDLYAFLDYLNTGSMKKS